MFLAMKLFRSIFLFVFFLPVAALFASEDLHFDIVKDKRVEYPRITNQEMVVFQGDTIIKVMANGLPAIIARPDQDVSKLLAAVSLSKSRFAAYNDFSPVLLDDLITGAVYYLKPKKNSADVPFHITGPKETLWDVAQMYGIKKKKLLKKNRISPTEDLKPGRKLLLQKKRSKKDPIEIINLPDDTIDEGPWERFIEDKDKKTTKTIGENNNDPKKSDLLPSVNPDAKFHTVRDGETIFSIAKVYKVTPLEIKKWNNLDNINLKKGDIIQVKPTSTINNNNIAVGNNNPLLPSNQNTNNSNNNDAILLPSVNSNNTTNNNINNAAINSNPNYNTQAGNYYGNTVNNNVSNANTNNSNLSIPANKTHLVERGEGIYSIARKYNLSPKDVMKWNGLTNNSLLDVGEQIYLAPGMAPPVKHDVKKGETLYRISKKYNIEVNDLMSWNQLSSTDIQAGQSLFVSQPNFANNSDVSTTGWQQTDSNNYNNAANINTQNNQATYSSTQNSLGNFNQVATSSQNNLNTNNTNSIYNQPAVNNNTTTKSAGYHTVSVNENIYEIAAKYKVKVDDLRTWNNLQVGTNIKAGDKVIVDPNVIGANNNSALTQPATNSNTNNNLLAPATENNTNTNFLQPATDSNSALGVQGDSNSTFHVVKKNENLFSIARTYGVQVSQIKKLSNKTNNEVTVGERLRIK